MRVLDINEICALFVELLRAFNFIGLRNLKPGFFLFVDEGRGGGLLWGFIFPDNCVDKAIDGAFDHLLGVIGVLLGPIIREVVFIGARDIDSTVKVC